MKGEPVEYGGFVVYPEYCDLAYNDLKVLSARDDNYYVATMPILGYNMCIVFRGGRKVLTRPKYRIHASEDVMPGFSPPCVVELGGSRVLILICYEMLFPDDYMQAKDVDFVVHMVGEPMHDEEQREGWAALHKVLAYLYSCPVICCCGGVPGRMNLSGVV